MNIREARERAGLTQGQLAEKVGVTQGEISRIEAGQRGISVPRLKAIALSVGVEPAALLDSVPDAA